MHSPHNPLAERAKALGLTLIQRDHIPNSRRAHECTEFARGQGKLEAFHRAVIKRYWTLGEDIHEWSVLRDAAAEAGLDGAQMQTEVERGTFRITVQMALKSARQAQVTAVPTFVIANSLMIQGAETADTFRQAFAQLGVTPRP